MIFTTEMPPHPALSPYVRCYTYREFDTGGETLVRPWYSIQQISIPFFFKAVPIKLTDPGTGKTLKTGKATGVVGMGRQFNGNMSFRGNYAFFEILFRPAGFSAFFKVPGGEIVDHIFWGEEILPRGYALLQEKMFHAASHADMSELVNRWLLKQLASVPRTDTLDRIVWAANVIVRHRGHVCPAKLSGEINMSSRNFERHFVAETGLSPKHLCCVTRFNYALETKLENPGLGWTAIAQDAGYYDQMHLIKDFRRFAGEAPGSLLRESPMMQIEYSERAGD